MIVADVLHMDILIIENHGSVPCKKQTRTVIVYKRNDHYASIVYNYTVINVASEVRSCADTQDKQLQDVDNVCSTLFQDGKCDRDELCTTDGNDCVLFRRDDRSISNNALHDEELSSHELDNCIVRVKAIYTEMNICKSNDITAIDNVELHMHKYDDGDRDTGKASLHSGELNMHDCDDINGAVTHIGGFSMHEHDCDSSCVSLYDDDLHVHDIGPLSYKGEIDMPGVMHEGNYNKTV